MAVKIQIKRGSKAGLPKLAPGEHGLATDTEELFIGGENGNLQISVLNSDGQIPDQQMPEWVKEGPFLPKSGGTMTGPINMANQRITNLPKAAEDNDPLRKLEGLSAATAQSLGLASTATPDEAFAKIKALLDTSNTNINSKVKIITGQYAGDGSSQRTISISMTPKAVLVIMRGFRMSDSAQAHGGMAVTGYPAKSYDKKDIISVTTNGFVVHNRPEQGNTVNLNSSGEIYTYIAFS